METDLANLNRKMGFMKKLFDIFSKLLSRVETTLILELERCLPTGLVLALPSSDCQWIFFTAPWVRRGLSTRRDAKNT